MCDEYTYISKYVHLDIRCTSGVASYGKGGGGYLIAQHSRGREDSNFVDNCWHLCAQWCIADGSKLWLWQNPFCSEISSNSPLFLSYFCQSERVVENKVSIWFLFTPTLLIVNTSHWNYQFSNSIIFFGYRGFSCGS